MVPPPLSEDERKEPFHKGSARPVYTGMGGAATSVSTRTRQIAKKGEARPSGDGQMEEHAWVLSERGPASQRQPPGPGRGADLGRPASDFVGEAGNPGLYMKSPDFFKCGNSFKLSKLPHGETWPGGDLAVAPALDRKSARALLPDHCVGPHFLSATAARALKRTFPM